MAVESGSMLVIRRGECGLEEDGVEQGLVVSYDVCSVCVGSHNLLGTGKGLSCLLYQK